MKKIMILFFLAIVLVSCKKKNVECTYLYTDSNTGLADCSSATICEKCTKKQRKKAIDELKSSPGYSDVNCTEK